MEKLKEPQTGRKFSRGEKLTAKSLPLLSVLLDSPQAISEIQTGHVASAIAGCAFAAGIGFAGSHLILNNGPKFKESWQGIKDWSHIKKETAKRIFPSKKRAILAGALATTGFFVVGDGAVQTAQGDFGSAANAATTGAILEGAAGLNFIQPHIKKRKEYEASVLGGTLSRQTDLLEQLKDAITERGEIIATLTHPQEEGPMSELQESQTFFLEGPEVNL